ncbi:MAG: sigma 54-interacting transcriptional regulator [Clostridiales Family XIII bacterium]|nr:sigma 54-interacting transcriptional regulator [Clostridiales Family XIII bacterium]
MHKLEFEKMISGNDIFDKDILSDFVYNSHDGLFVVDKNGKLVLANPAVVNMLDMSYEELIGHRIADIIDSGAYEGSPSTKAAESGEIYTGLVKTRGGIEIMSTSKPVFDDNGGLQYVITNCRPLSVIKKFYDRYYGSNNDITGMYDQLLTSRTKYIYNSKQMKEIVKRSFYASQTDCAIILLGQTGTGKGVMAKYIHENSKRSKERFLELNCAALPENLLESELFGYEKGAFTGANDSGKKGLLEIANNGTLFLDEIGEMPLQIQAKLLKVLDSGFLMRVGGTVSRKINVRIISATNRNLKTMMKVGTFREDLYYRLNVISIKIPPLKERKDEIKDIAENLLQKSNELYQTNKVFAKGAVDVLYNYNWPGNIRQLNNFIQRAVILSMQENTIGKEFLSELLSGELSDDDEYENGDRFSAGGHDRSDLDGNREETLKDYMTRVELAYIRKVINESNGSIAKAAEKLDVHRTAIYKKIRNGEDDK